MALSDAVQSLSAAFSFGILLQAATGALFLYWRGHGSTIFKDGRRLVLLLFIIFAALWAQVDFINLLLPTTSSTTCQATLIISTIFDQLARVAIEQFLLWSVGHGTKLTAERLILQIVLLIRLVAGGALVGFTRPQFAPLCLAQTSVLPIAVVVLALDAVLILVLLVRALSLGMFKQMRGKSSTPNQEQSKALILTIVGLALWTITSIPMVLGVSTIILLVRTVVPANGLLILVGIVTMFPGALLESRNELGTTPEASSPFITPMPPSREIFRENVGSEGSPVTYNNKGSNLFVVNPSSTPRTPVQMYQGNSRRNSRGFTKLGEEITVTGVSQEGPRRPERPEVSRNIPGYRGSSGIFPNLGFAAGGSDGAMAPQIRPQISVRTDISGPLSLGGGTSSASTTKRGLFNWSKPPQKLSVRSLGISQPIATDSAQPLPRMQTIDLATAANNERERREGAAAKARLAESRPVQVPAFSTAEAFQRSVSTKRKQAPARPISIEPLPSLTSTLAASNDSRDVANGSTTSASISPGREEVRRRSPRSQPNTFEALIDEKAAIRPLERKATLGLPSNPRSQRTAIQPLLEKQPTVMLMNNIVYNDPGMVSTIINGAPGMYTKRPKTAEKSSFSSTSTFDSIKSSGSIIHRPRPYKKSKEEGRASFYPAEASPKRPKSSGSIVSRKSLLMVHPGSPTDLPPLPQPPRSAAELRRLLPNSSKSMTFDEKIQLMFPAPPGTNANNRRSSVPDIPRVPSVFIADTPGQSPTGTSKRTTLASFKLEELLAQEKSPKRSEERQTYRFSANTYRTLADDVGETSAPVSKPPVTKAQPSLLAVPQRESVLKDLRISNFSVSDASSHDSTSFWGGSLASIHSEIAPVSLSKVMQNAQETYIERNGIARPDSDIVPRPDLPTIDIDDGEIVTVMLDSEEARKSLILTASDTNRRSFFLEAEQELSEEKPVAPKVGLWHRRIGDELPTFSERPTRQRSRKMPPPTPLLLNRNTRQVAVVIRPTEPSPPVDSPSRALQEIQAQLKRFEEPDRDSVGAILRNLPGSTSNVAAAETNNNRRLLLDNLEAEMGLQETNWQQMQRDLDRDSMSVLMTPEHPVAPSEATISRESSQKSSRTPSQIVARRARIRSGMTNQSKGDESIQTSSSQSSENSRASVWQQRLADAQMVYMENTSELLHKKSLNFLSISKAQLGSPTPPESLDSESEVETEFDSENEDAENPQPTVQIRRALPSLWQPSPAAPKAAETLMWNSSNGTASVKVELPTPPAQNVRPAQRQIQAALPVFTSDLWKKPASAEHSRPVVGLWGSRLVRPRSIVTRRVTQRPQRKSKRVTFLPDIIESPVPLPNKRDTLGIFQFPWGEKSDQPIYQPAFNPALLAGPSLNATLDNRARQLEAAEYSSSFFDDYEEEAEGDAELDSDDDDDFDETTLWEIANLLDSKDVPSKQSLLPAPRGITEDFDILDSEAQAAIAAAPPLRLPIQPLAMPEREDLASIIAAVKKQSSMWSKETSVSKVESGVGLPQPEESVWNAMVPSSEDVMRSKPQSFVPVPALTTSDLWAVSASEPSDSTSSTMWAAKGVEAPAPRQTKTSSSLMWNPVPVKAPASVDGLFSAAIVRDDFRSSTMAPAALEMARKPRTSQAPLPALVSNKLWRGQEKQAIERDWITESSTRPESPLIYSPSSSGNSSPISDASSIKSTSTKASSIFSMAARRAMLKKIPSLSDMKKSSRIPESLPEDNEKHPSKIPVRNIPTLPSVRESRVLTARNMFEPTAPAMDANPQRRLRRATIVQKPSVAAKPAAPIKPSDIPMRKLHRPAAAFSADWASALAEAIAAGTPKKVTVRSAATKPERPFALPRSQPQSKRVAATADMWNSALTEAMARSQPRLQRVNAAPDMWTSALMDAIKRSPPRVQRIDATLEMWAAALLEAAPKAVMKRTTTSEYDPAVLHPVFFTKSFVCRSSDIHPAATGHFTKAEIYDPAVLHPVFFTKSLVSKSKEIHPAAIGHVVKTPTYNPATLHPVFFTKSLISNIKDIHPAAIGHITKNQAYDPAVLHPVFFTTSLDTNAHDIHPAAIGHLPQKAGVWRASSATSNPKSDSAMWSTTGITPPRNVPRDADIIKLAGDSPQRKPVVRSAELPILNSKEFWQPSSSITQERNWLSSSSMKPQHTMWAAVAAPTAPKADSAFMWTKAESVPNSDASALALAGDAMRKKPVTRSVDLPSLESKNFWQPAPAVAEERDWLSQMRPQSTMWKASPVPERRNSEPMWSKNTTQDSTPMMKLSGDAPQRKSLVARESELPVLESKTFWHPSQPITTERDWISVKPKEVSSPQKSAKRPAPEMWSPPTGPVLTRPGPMWTKDAIDQGPTMKLSGEPPLRKTSFSKSIELPILQSKSFWQPTKSESTERNWILAKPVSTTKAITQSKSVAPTKMAAPSREMWSAPTTPSFNEPGHLWTKNALPSAPVFTFKGETVRKVAAAKTLELPILQSSTFWQPSKKEAVERNWIVAKPEVSSKLETQTKPTAPVRAQSTPQPQATMWTAPTTPSFNTPGTLWTKNASPSTPTLNLSGDAPPRKLSMTKSLDLPILTSTSFWAPSTTTTTERHWITATAKPRPASRSNSNVSSSGTWTPRSSSPVSSDDGKNMWSSISSSAPDMFELVKNTHIKPTSSRPEGLAELTSTSLFSSKPVERENVNWIQRSSSLPLVPTLQSQEIATAKGTWVAPAPAQEGEKEKLGVMWESKDSLKEESRFENPHSLPWSRKKRDKGEEVRKVEVGELWRRDSSLPESPTNWLEKRRGSRVEFRY